MSAGDPVSSWSGVCRQIKPHHGAGEDDDDEDDDGGYSFHNS